MSIPRPKFCVGEVVDVVGSFPGRGVEIIKSEYCYSQKSRLEATGEMFRYTGWSYVTSDYPELWTKEMFLRKRRDDNWQNIREIWVPEGEIA